MRGKKKKKKKKKRDQKGGIGKKGNEGESHLFRWIMRYLRMS